MIIKMDNVIRRPPSKDLFLLFHTNIVTASFTTPAMVTVTALVTETRMYSVNTCSNYRRYIFL
jgi:hypothetical protein